jgi:hypothetical protein
MTRKFIAIFALSRLLIHVYRPFLVYGGAFHFTIPLQYSNLGTPLAQLFGSRFFEGIWMLMTLANAWMMNEVMEMEGVLPLYRAIALYGYIFWFGTIQAETYFSYTQPMSLMVTAMVYYWICSDAASLFVIGLCIMATRSMYNPFSYHGGNNLGFTFYYTTCFIRAHTGIGLPWAMVCDHTKSWAVVRWCLMQDLRHPLLYLQSVAHAAYTFFSLTARYPFHVQPAFNWVRDVAVQPVILALFILGVRGWFKLWGPGDCVLPLAFIFWTLFMSVCISLGEGNYYRIPIEPLLWIGIAL